MLKFYNDFLTHNKQWLDVLSATIAFTSGMFGIFYKSTVVETEDNKKRLTGWGLFTLITLIVSSFIQYSLKQASAMEANSKAKADAAEQQKRDNRLKASFQNQLNNLNKISRTVLKDQKLNEDNFRQAQYKLNASLTGLRTMGNSIDGQFKKTTKNFAGIYGMDSSLQQQQMQTLHKIQASTQELKNATEVSSYPLEPIKFDIAFALDISRPEFANYLKRLKQLAFGKRVEDLKPEQFWDAEIFNDHKYAGMLNNFYFNGSAPDTIGFTKSFDKKRFATDSNTVLYYQYNREVSHRIIKKFKSYWLIEELKITATNPRIKGKSIMNARDLKGYTFFFLRHFYHYINDNAHPGFCKRIAIEFDKQSPYVIPFEPEFSFKNYGYDATDLYITCEKWDNNEGMYRAIDFEDEKYREKAANP